MQGTALSKIPSISNLKHVTILGKNKDSPIFTKSQLQGRRRLDKKRSMSAGSSLSAPEVMISEH